MSFECQDKHICHFTLVTTLTMYPQFLSVASLLLHCALAAPTTQHEDAILAKRTTFPFKRVVAFGDDMTDNGDGSSHTIPRTSTVIADLFQAPTHTASLVSTEQM